MANTDVTEKGLAMRETYAKLTDPWLNMFSITAGLLRVPFGFELTQSSSEVWVISGLTPTVSELHIE